MPSILPEFEYDVFISYRQNDNRYDGWVTEFVNNLTKELEATLKNKVTVYFDSNPHDGLLETNSVHDSLAGKLKCLIFIPIFSKTYCDPNSFAWKHEFLAFIHNAAQDRFGLNVRLHNGNVSSRVLPVRIHDLDPDDVHLAESYIGPIRSIDFIYHLPGVNRSLRPWDDDVIKNTQQPFYRDQINKVANAIGETLRGLAMTEKSKSDNAHAYTQDEKSIHNEKQLHRETFHQSEKVEHKELVAEKVSIPRTNKSTNNRAMPSMLRLGLVVAALMGLGAAGMYGFRTMRYTQEVNRARAELIPAIVKELDDSFRPTFEVYNMAVEARQYLPHDSVLNNLWSRITTTFPIESEPPGAEIFWKDYVNRDMPWQPAGITPAKEVTVPRRYIRMEFRKPGYQTVEFSGPWPYSLLGQVLPKIKLDATGSLPEGMVRIPEKVTPMTVVGLEAYGRTTVGEFLIDKYEVTNKQYKTFVDAGGYTNKAFWKFPIVKDGVTLSFDEGMKLLKDRTGIAGPSTWEAGTYPDGQADHPVAGVSWYEAMAYATYAKKELPTAFHWSVIAETSRTEFLVPISNFNGKGTTTVGSMPNLSTFGVYDVAGNVREWCYNQSSAHDQRFVLGGGWDDQPYAFNDSYTQSPLNRNQANGFRCMVALDGDTTLTTSHQTLMMDSRDYSKEAPVDDKAFELFKRQYAYDKQPLNDSTTLIAATDLYTVEKVTFDAAYNHERMQAYIFKPTHAKEPTSPVLFFGGSGDIYSKKFNIEIVNRGMTFVIKSGRTLVMPVFKGTHERHDELKSDVEEPTVFYKDHVIMWAKDIGRTIDYLETRKDIDASRVAYFGWSWGGALGNIMPAVEKRIKVVVLNVGGLTMHHALPEADPINFVSRVTQPVLMLNGEFDMFVPVESSQKPMFKLLGTPAADKKMFLYKTGHQVPLVDLARETLTWLDKYQ
ncbi:MAG: SUMF1/EgtB/PvdO family nonheme iron enzyme [Chryseolinea sp.]